MNDELIKKCGMKMAEGWLESAISSGTAEQKRNQLSVLEYASVHVLGHLVANVVKQEHVSMDDETAEIAERVGEVAEKVLEGIESGKTEKILFFEQRK